jgi:hypothetical protein
MGREKRRAADGRGRSRWRLEVPVKVVDREDLDVDDVALDGAL